MTPRFAHNKTGAPRPPPIKRASKTDILTIVGKCFILPPIKMAGLSSLVKSEVHKKETTLIRNYNTYFLVKMASSSNVCTQKYVNIGTILGLTPTIKGEKVRESQRDLIVATATAQQNHQPCSKIKPLDGLKRL